MIALDKGQSYFIFACYILRNLQTCRDHARAEITTWSQHLFLTIHPHFDKHCTLFGKVLKTSREVIKIYNTHCIHCG